MKRRLAPFVLLLASCAGSPAPTPSAPSPPPTLAAERPSRWRAIVDGSDRSEHDRALDAGRHPAELLAFLALEPGMRVADLGAGPGYTTELLARAVGPKGAVYMQNEPDWLPFMKDDLKERFTHPVMSGGTVLREEREFEDPFPDAKNLDAVVMNVIYHDVANTPTDRPTMNRHVFEALKPGGRYVIVDSSAPAGSGLAATETLHRIDEQVVKDEVLRAGFKLVREESFLRNPADARDWNSSPGAATKAGKRGTSDRFVLAFERPIGVAAARAADTSPSFAYETVKVAEGIYAFIPPEPKTELVTGNSIVVIGDDGALVVDTGHFPSLARKMIGEIRRLTDKPVRYVVNTHWHPDHVFGNAAYRQAFPGAVVLAHAATRRLLLKNDPQFIEQQRTSADYLAPLRTALSTGKHRDGRALRADERSMVEGTIPVVESVLADADVTLSPETMTFENEVTLFLGKREVRVMHLGRGNTAGDAVVYVPDAKVLATGDLVVNPTPYAFGSYLGEWAGALKKLASIDATVLVPGHGPVEHDFEYVKTLLSLLDATREQVKAGVKAGLTLEQVRRKVDLDSFAKRLAGDDAARRFGFRTGYVEPAVERAYEEAKGKLTDE